VEVKTLYKVRSNQTSIVGDITFERSKFIDLLISSWLHHNCFHCFPY